MLLHLSSEEFMERSGRKGGRVGGKFYRTFLVVVVVVIVNKGTEGGTNVCVSGG